MKSVKSKLTVAQVIQLIPWYIYSEELVRVGTNYVPASLWFRKITTFRFNGKRYWRYHR